MKKLNQKLVLEAKITYLKNKQTTDFTILKTQYHETIDSFTPFNMLKNSVESILTTPNLKGKLLSQALNLGVTYLTKGGILTSSENPMQGILGKIILFGLNKITRKKTKMN
jgi:hypothetical protein